MNPADLIERLREAEHGDHSRGCEGRQYTCSCGYDHRIQTAATEAADTLAANILALAERDATIARQSAAIMEWSVLAQKNSSEAVRWQGRAETAESALAEIRAENERLKGALAFADEQSAKVEALLEPHITWEPGTVRICPMRDGPCPHGLNCRFVGDGYMGWPCKDGWRSSDRAASQALGPLDGGS